MKKHFLFLPFLALLATSCASYANTTTPVVKNAPSASLTTPTEKPLITPTGYEDNVPFNFSFQSAPPANSQTYYKLDGSLWQSGESVPTMMVYNSGTYQYMSMYWANGHRLCITDYVTDIVTTGQVAFLPNQWTPFGAWMLQSYPCSISGVFHFKPVAHAYQNGYDEGFDEGYYSGEASGYTEGYNEGLTEGQEEGFGLALAQSQFSSPSAKYDGFIFLPSHELLRQYCVDLWTGTKTFQPFVVNFLSDDFSTNPNSEHNKEETPLVFKYIEEQATDTHLIYIYWGDPNWYRTTNQVGDPTDNADFELKQVAVINIKDIANNVWASTRIAQWNSTNWEWEVPLTPSTPYFGKPLTIPMAKKIHRGNFFLGNTAIWSPSEIINLDSFYIGTPTSAQNATIQEELNILFVGSGSLYAQGYEDGQQEAIETSEAYNNVFLIFLPAFSAVASFFNMSVGPFKLYYFFVIPLIVAILVLVIKLVKH